MNKERTAVFIGHSNCPLSAEAIIPYIEQEILNGVDTFLNGGQGSFDYACARAVCQLKKKYTKIKSVLVIPYHNFKIRSEGAKEVIAVVCNYSWDTHIYKKNRYDARLKYYEAWHGSSNYFVEKQGRHKTKVLFVDIKDKSKKLLCEAGLKVKFYNEYNNTAYLKYPLRCCKVNNKDFKTFKKVMDKIRETGACDDYYDYATNWFKKEK